MSADKAGVFRHQMHANISISKTTETTLSHDDIIHSTKSIWPNNPLMNTAESLLGYSGLEQISDQHKMQ